MNDEWLLSSYDTRIESNEFFLWQTAAYMKKEFIPDLPVSIYKKALIPFTPQGVFIVEVKNPAIGIEILKEIKGMSLEQAKRYIDSRQ